MKISKNGFYDLSDDDYFADPCPTPSLSATDAITLLNATPAHAWWNNRRLNPDYEAEESNAFDLGRSFHELMTGQDREVFVIDAKDYRTKAAKEQRDEARSLGLTPLLKHENQLVQHMVRRAREQMRAHGIGDPFEGGENEKALIWREAGVWNRVKPDCLDRENRVIYDLKTCAGLAEPEGWVRTGMPLGIDLRAAMYLAGAKAVFGGEWSYRYVPIEKKPPHCLSVLELSEGILFIGESKLRRAQEIWKLCLSRKKWPGYSDQIAVVEPPAFWIEKWLNRELREEDVRQRTGKDAIEASIDFQRPLEGATP